MAGSYFRPTRNVELSTLEFITDSVNADWTGITVVKSFKEAYDATIAVPIICIRIPTTYNARLEIGTTTLENRYMLVFDIFTRSGAQRVDLADYVADKLKDGWIYYAYSHVSGNNSQVIGENTGRIFVTDWLTNTKVEMGENADPKDKFRHTISILVRQSSNQISSSSSSSSCRSSSSSSSSSSCRSSSSSSSSSIGS